MSDNKQFDSNRRYALLDRDGTLIVDRTYLSKPCDMQILPRAAEGLRELRSLGFGLLIVTNQSGIGRGLFGADQLDAIHERLKTELLEQGVVIDGTYVCPHRPDDSCQCRKPQVGLVEQARADFGFRTERCVVIGDKPCDWELAERIGAFSIGLAANGKRFNEMPNAWALDLVEAAKLTREHSERLLAS